jgi:cysteinyl-tRNA synthetase
MLTLFNTLTKKKEQFSPMRDKMVLLYSCGPTVYDYAHIGNFRTYMMTDFLVRTLTYFGYHVRYVMNITDVGHLTSDSDTGEDKLEKGARREGKSAWDIAKYYTDVFLSDSHKLNLREPDVRPRPTEHIQEQITMVQTLLDKDLAYDIDDGIYFDTSKFEDYGALTDQSRDELKEGARVEPNPQKRNPTDFALWKRSPNPPDGAGKRQMEWESPWGIGFPGWHIECSAMSMKHLGPQLDIHTGGVDLIPIHHTNEIAQSEGATGQEPFVRYWVHGQFIQVDGEKMSKSKANFYRLDDILKRGFDPLALRYLYLTAHYRAFLNFTWEALAASSNALTELRRLVAAARRQGDKGGRSQLSSEKMSKAEKLQQSFDTALSDDLNIPKALAVAWEVAKSNIPSQDKYDMLLRFDEVLGLGLNAVETPDVMLTMYTHEATGFSYKAPGKQSDEVEALLSERDQARRAKNFPKADEIRATLVSTYNLDVKETSEGTVVLPRAT